MDVRTLVLYLCIKNQAKNACQYHSPEMWGGATGDAQGAYPQLHCVCPKRWQRLHWTGPFGATYDSTDTRKPQSSVNDRSFDTSGPRATDIMMCGVRGRAVLGGVLVASAGTQLRYSLDTNILGFQLLSDDALRHTPTQVLHRSRAQMSSGSGVGVETHTVLPIEGRQRIDSGSEPFGV